MLTAHLGKGPNHSHVAYSYPLGPVLDFWISHSINPLSPKGPFFQAHFNGHRIKRPWGEKQCWGKGSEPIPVVQRGCLPGEGHHSTLAQPPTSPAAIAVWLDRKVSGTEVCEAN